MGRKMNRNIERVLLNKLFKGTLVSLTTGRLRENFVIGYFDDLPTEGKCFRVASEGPTDLKPIREIITSPVEKVGVVTRNQQGFTLQFSTQSGSLYILEYVFQNLCKQIMTGREDNV